MNILLFERSLEIKFQIVRYIEQLCAKCNVTTVSSIPSTIQEILKGHFDIIIVDIDFTGKQFNEMLKVIRDTSPKTILIVLTFYPNENVKNKLLSGGVMHYFDKIIQFGELIKLIKKQYDLFISNIDVIPQNIPSSS